MTTEAFAAQTITRTYEVVYEIYTGHNTTLPWPSYPSVEEALDAAKEILTSGEQWVTVEIIRRENDVTKAGIYKQ